MAIASVQRLRSSVSNLDTLDPDVDVVLGLLVDDRPLAGLAGWLDWRLGGELSRCMQSKLCTGQIGEQVLLSCRGRIGAERLFVFGLGERKKVKQNTSRFFESLQSSIKNAHSKRLALLLPLRGAELEVLQSQLINKLDCQELFIFSDHARMELRDLPGGAK